MLTKTRKVDTVCAEDVFCGVNMVPDVDSSTDLEKKHLPMITAPEHVQKDECFEVTVEVGKLMAHPNEPGHFIQFIELYAGDTYLMRTDFTAATTWPVLKAWVTLNHAHGKLRAFARCNLHGTWQNEFDIEVDG